MPPGMAETPLCAALTERKLGRLVVTIGESCHDCWLEELRVHSGPYSFHELGFETASL
jgi:hypothetical protein